VTVLPGKASASAVRLVSAAESLPKELEAVLLELGAGDSRFNGPSFGRGDCDLPAFFATVPRCRRCREGSGPPRAAEHLLAGRSQ